MSWHTNLAFTCVTLVPTVTFSLMWMGPYTLWSHLGGLLFLSTTSNSTSTSAYEGGVPLSEARTLRRYLSRYWQNMGRQVTGHLGHCTIVYDQNHSFNHFQKKRQSSWDSERSAFFDDQNIRWWTQIQIYKTKFNFTKLNIISKTQI